MTKLIWLRNSGKTRGKGASRRLRKEGKVPAILYGAGRPPRAISLQHNKLMRALEDESTYSSILNIMVGDKNQETILKDLQRHPSKNEILHVDLQRIVADEDIRTNVPLHFINEETAPGVKLEGGTVTRQINDVEITCLPKYLPEFIEVDLGEMKLGDIVHLSDLKLPEGVKVPALDLGEEHDQPVVSIVKMRAAAAASDDDAADAAAGEGEEGTGE